MCTGNVGVQLTFVGYSQRRYSVGVSLPVASQSNDCRPADNCFVAAGGQSREKSGGVTQPFSGVGVEGTRSLLGLEAADTLISERRQNKM